MDRGKLYEEGAISGKLTKQKKNLGGKRNAANDHGGRELFSAHIVLGSCWVW